MRRDWNCWQWMTAAAAGVSLAVAGGCGDDPPTDPSEPEFVYGAPVTVGAGQARSYVLLDRETPLEIGIALSEAALTDLPVEAMMYEYLLPLPATNPTPIRLVELDWNPMGHPPPQIYTVPHFDFHFYTVTQPERDAIDPADPDFQVKVETFRRLSSGRRATLRSRSGYPGWGCTGSIARRPSSTEGRLPGPSSMARGTGRPRSSSRWPRWTSC